MAQQTIQQRRDRESRTDRAPASWRRFATRPRSPMTGLTMYGPWSTLKPYALKLLKHDHRVIRPMLKELEHAKLGGERGRRLARVEGEFAVHSRILHEVVYPAYRSVCKTAKHRAVYHELVEQHRACELLLADLQKCATESARFAGCAKALRLNVLDLFGETQHRLFHYARKLLGRANLKALGRSMQDHRRAILRNPAMTPLSSVGR
ncbi:MAG: hemerythrin domain-containing protein [Thermoplasmatota archaeon]|nr:hypothetical protein [Halobacteriales archaeon]